jgi:hypothetical protein
VLAVRLVGLVESYTEPIDFIEFLAVQGVYRELVSEFPLLAGKIQGNSPISSLRQLSQRPFPTCIQ